jgi:hypothetical protein
MTEEIILLPGSQSRRAIYAKIDRDTSSPEREEIILDIHR